MQRHARTVHGLGIAALALICLAAGAAAAKTPIAFLAGSAPVEKLGPEARAAYDLASKQHGAALLRVTGDGTFAGASGKPANLSDFRVIWYHQGDSTVRNSNIYGGKTLRALQDYVKRGGGLYLSGAALAMVNVLGVEPISPRVGGPGKDTSPAGLVPVRTKHPIFAGLAFAGRTVHMSNAGHPAYADFHGSGGPSGMLLARSSGGGENPLVEYDLQKGRIVAMGWRLPHYSHAANPHRANLEKITANILTYLGDRKQWQTVVRSPVKPRTRTARARPAPTADISFNVRAMRLAITDLIKTHGPKYPKGAEYLKRLDAIEKDLPAVIAGVAKGDAAAKAQAAQIKAFQAEALLANPLIDFDKLLLVKRSTRNLGLSANWQSNSSVRNDGYDNEIAVLSPVAPGGELTTLFKPAGTSFVGDVDLDFDARRLLFSIGRGKNKRWQIAELDVDPSTGRRAGGEDFREVPLITQADVDNYDACYLPDGNIMFTSTAPFIGVPCVTGSSHVTNIYHLTRKTGSIRRLTFDQDHNWCPTVLNNGRVLYLRWEYTDIPHYVARILFHMNPDGTDQKEYYGSNSYWPNSMFYARPVPGSSSKFAAVISGHHDTHRMGELILFDINQGRFEADGVVQRIPGHGQKVEPIISDALARGKWPMFLHPYPLSDKHMLVSAQPTRRSLWGVYLVDTFDNMVLLAETPGYVLFEPVPLRKTPRPPVVPSMVDPSRKDAVMYLANVYAGPGLKDVPVGAVKKLRLFTYQFSYHGMGGQVNRVGLDGPWDVKRVLGIVPVESDGSALFRVPANTPISIQPLDSDGRAVALMRSWTTAMPGEVQSCIGCHMSQNSTAPPGRTAAVARDPSKIALWYGPTRGFSFEREVQPVLDKYCVGCHDGKARDDGKALPDFTPRPAVHPKAKSGGYNNGTRFTPSYMALRAYTRPPSIESDMHMLPPYEFHASTARVVQMLEKGHHNVTLDAEGWDRLVTWIDLHAPAHGTWRDIVGDRKVDHQRDRRRAMMKLYAYIDEDPEAIPEAKPTIKAIMPPPEKKVTPTKIECAGWPFDAETAAKRQAVGGPAKREIDLGGDVKLALMRVPTGRFVMGSDNGFADERPRKAVEVKAFWMGRFEVTNAQFAAFDPKHDSRLEHGDFLQFSIRERGYPLNAPTQPVVRVSWDRAAAFCQWLSKKTGAKVALPTEAQWEYACRAGTETPMSYGPLGADFSKHANLADKTFRFMPTYGWGLPSGAVPPWRPAIDTVNDNHRISAPVGSFKPNAWGLHDMHGNAAEWTSGVWTPRQGGRASQGDSPRRVVRGGSWQDRPAWARSAGRTGYNRWQGVVDVGFRIVVEE